LFHGSLKCFTMVKQVTIKFFPRLDFKMEGGKIPIYVRVILDREKFEFSSKQVISKISDWDEVTQRVKIAKSPVNNVLSEIVHKVNEAYNFLKYHNRPLTALALRKQLKGEKIEKLSLLGFFEDYYQDQIKSNFEFAPATKATYYSTLVHLRKFLEETGKVKLRLTEVDTDFINDFDSYLVNRSISEKKGLRKNSANKYQVKLKTILFKAVDKKLIDKNPYTEIKFKHEPGRLTYLTTNELEKLESHDLGGNESLKRVRDIFLFSVYTGLRHSDATALTKDNVEMDGKELWIVYTQKKTNDSNRIPMLKKAAEIYNKYEDERKITGYVLPRLSHQKLNVYLKTIANLAGIKKPLSHHVARHTAATTVFMQNGISLETTGKLLGHKSIKSTQVYAKVTNMMLKEAASKLNKLL
jgi:site-specific recombinase XerD